MNETLAVIGALVLVVLLIAYAIYRANKDPTFAQPMEREVTLVPFALADDMLRSAAGWRLAPEEDYNRRRGWVYLERWKPKIAPAEPQGGPPNANRWNDLH